MRNYIQINKKENACEAHHSCVTVLLLHNTCNVLLLFRLGSKKFNYLELSEQIDLKTGGLNVSTHLDESALRIEDYEEVMKIPEKKGFILS